jgi:hypothetical protein
VEAFFGTNFLGMWRGLEWLTSKENVPTVERYGDRNTPSWQQAHKPRQPRKVEIHARRIGNTNPSPRHDLDAEIGFLQPKGAGNGEGIRAAVAELEEGDGLPCTILLKT